MKRKHDQRGALSPVLIVVIVIVIGVIGFAGYSVYNNKKKDQSTTSNATISKEVKEEVNAACIKEVNDKDLCKFLSNWENSKTYKATIVSTDAQGQKNVMKLEADGDNTSSTVLDNDKETSAYISLNKVYYMKDEEKGVWYKMPSTQTPAATETNPVSKLSNETKEPETAGETKNTTTYKKIGKEACGNKTCFKYQIIDTSDSETVESYVWFSDSDYKLVRWSTKSKDGSTSDSNFSYDKVTIVAPTPVQDYQMPDLPQ